MFILGCEYKRTDLHDQYGGQRQGGISTPKNHPIVIIFTGPSGHAYGYEDGFREDGLFWYTGEGQVGDMLMRAGNKAILEHEVRGKALHIFEIVRKGFVRCVGEARYADHEFRSGPDRNGDPRKAIVFGLEMLTDEEPPEVVDAQRPSRKEPKKLWQASLEALRKRALDAGPGASETKKERLRRVRQRSAAVRVYVLRRADGRCEGCGSPAPFNTPSGRPYLEPHHIRRLADGGPDHPRWVIALCPNCHREVHYGCDGALLNKSLATMTGELELAQSPHLVRISRD
jgi:5-methylcytosine-specific restriction enzyme A